MNKGLATILIIPFLLSGCILGGPTSQSSSSSSSTSQTSGSQPTTTTTTTTSTTTIPPTTTSTQPPQPSDDPFPEPEKVVIDTSDFSLNSIPINITAINDFHGQVDEVADEYKVGLAKMSTYLKSRKRAGDILINSGDMYQGSFLASYDKGKFLTYAFRNIGFDATILGNHEFDWGIQPIIQNPELIDGYYLCANVYEYPKVNNEWQKSALAHDYKVITLYEDTPFEVKVGVIGAIGKDQITSITSTIAKDYIFLDPTPIVKNIATHLRRDVHCDVVVASYHDGDPDTSIADIDPESNKPYVDVCFKAHTHRFQYSLVNNVPFIQGGAYGRGVSGVNFAFNKQTDVLTRVDSGYKYLNETNSAPDPIMVEQIERQKQKDLKKYTVIVGNNDSGDEIDVYNMSAYYGKLSYDYAVAQRPDLNIIGTLFNESRQPLKRGEFTYADLFQTHPFMNKLYVLSVRGNNLKTQIGYSSGYLNYNYDDIKDTEYYDVVTFDYNGLHIGVNDNYEKYYNYFSTAFSQYAKHQPILLGENCFNLALQSLTVDPNITAADFSGEGFFIRTT